MKLYWRVIKYIKPHWKHVLAGIFFTILFVFFNAVSVWVSADFLREQFMPQKDTAVLQEGEPAQETESREEWVVNQLGKQRIYIKMKEGMQSIIVRENKFETLKVVCIVLFLAFFLKNFSTVMQRIFFYFVQLKIVVRLRNELQRSMLRLPLSFYHKEHTGNLTSVAFNDVNRIQTVLNSSFVKIFLAPLQVLVYLVVLLLISWKLTLATFAIIPISGYLIIKIGQSMRRKSTRVLEQISIVLKSFQESISSIRIVKAFTTEEKEIEKFARIN